MTPISKISDDQQILYGFASVISLLGSPVIDSQGDVIDSDELEAAATDAMLNGPRTVLHNHEGQPVGKIVHSLPLTEEIAKALGLGSDKNRYGWIVGIRVDDPTVWRDVKAGKLGMMSIGATAIREAM